MSNYWKKKLDELNEENGKKSSVSSDPSDYWGNKLKELEESKSKKNDIAPVAPTKTESKEEEKKRKWFEKGAFEDGYQFGDITKTIFASDNDLANNVTAGILGIGEKVVDAGAYAVGGVAGLFGNDELKDKTQDFIKKDLYDEQEVAKKMNSFSPQALTRKLLGVDTEEQSVFGEKTDSLAQSGGQLLGTVALQSVGVPWYVTSGVTSFGSEVETAFNEDATYLEAGLSGAISAGAEILTEKLFGGSGLGEKGLIKLDLLTEGISKKVVKSLVDFGLDMVAEGSEEIVSSVFNRLASSLYKEENLKDLLLSEEAFDEYVESFVGGMVLGGGMNVGNVTNSIQSGRDYRTGLTENEQKVVDKIYNDRVAEESAKRVSADAKDGKVKGLSEKERAEIYNSIVEEMEKGYISTDTIEEVLGGDTFKSYQDAAKQEQSILSEYEELGKKTTPTLAEQHRYSELHDQVKEINENSKSKQLKSQLRSEVFGLVGNDRLVGSYIEGEKRREKFHVDLSDYDEKEKEVVQKAIDSGVLNNTSRTHEFVGMVAKISADKGVLFDFTNNEKLKESGFAVEGKNVNGFVTKDGVTVNINSQKALNSVVGHEITHVLEGTELYTELQSALFEYAKTKKDYGARRTSIEALYRGIEGADVDAELTADLVGDYLFTDADFVKNLSTNHRNVFQKIYDEIKYLVKVATAGSKEARELERVKHAFDQAYKANGTAPSGTKYSLSDSAGTQLTAEQQEYFKDSKMRDDNGNLMVMYHGSQDAGFHVFDPSMSDDDTSLFFVDSNDVAASYSGTTETYEAQSIRSAEDMNRFIESIGAEGYEVVEQDGKYTLLYEGDRVADSNTAKGIYDEFCWYEGVGNGDANYKVYLNLKNPLVVDAKGRPWNKIDAEFSQEVYDQYKNLTAEEKAALVDLAEWEDFRLFNSEIQEARDNELASAYAKMGEDCNIYDLFSVAADNFSEEAMRENARHYLKTRDYAQRAKAQGYDGVIFKNIHDNGGYSNGSEGASTVAIAFDSNQIKSVANDKPTGDADIRYSLSADSEGRKINPAVAKRFGNSKVVDENGRLKVVYHGTATGEFSIFDKSKGSVEGDFGSGFYFTDSEADVADHYEDGGPDFDNKVARRAEQIEAEEDIDYDEAEKRAREELYKGGHKFEVYLNIENPATVGETILFDNESYFEQYDQEDYDNEEDYYGDVEQLVADDIDNIIWDIDRNVDVNSTDGIADILWEAFNDGGIGIEELKAKLNNLYLEDSNGNFVANEVARQIIESLGYDGIIDPTVSGKWNMDIEEGTKHYIVFKPNQIKAVTNENPTDNPDIHRSLSAKGEARKQYGNYNVYGEDVGLEKAPIKENAETSKPSTTESANNMENSAVDVAGEFAPISEEQANAQQSESLASLDDADAPPEMDAPFYGESEEITVDDPFEKRDIKAVGNPKTKAYMYENPEVKPFFQAEANIMLGELRDTTKGERWAIKDDDGDIVDWGGVKRNTSMDIAYLLDNGRGNGRGYTYDEIEAGLKAIIEDNGKENNACSKRIEFLLNDRLLKGNVDFQTGLDIPPNQDYINLLNEKQITEYNEEAFGRFMENADQFAPVQDVTRVQDAPVAESAPKEKYEAIRPPRQSAEPRMAEAEPRMRRADSDKKAPVGMEERSWYETSTESEAVDGMVTPDDIPDDVRFYKVKSNKSTLAAANARLEKDGYAKSREYFEGRMSERKLSVDDIALGERLIQEAAKAGDAKAVRDLIIDVSILGTELGQRVQALSIIQRLTPEGQLKALIRTVERGKAKGDPAFDGVEVTEDMTKRIMDTKKEDGTFDQAELDSAVEDVKQQIADQMSSGALDYINAWRYLSMLGNPKTHIRNVVSNVAMYGTRAVKNAVARTVEDVFLHNKKPTLNTGKPVKKTATQSAIPNGTRVRAKDRGNVGTIRSYNSQTGKYTVYFENDKGQHATVQLDAKAVEPLVAPVRTDGGKSSGGDIGPVNARTKTWARATDAVKAFAQTTTAEMESAISGNHKYSDEGSIKEKRSIFKTKVGNALNKANTAAMEWEDAIFSKNAFRTTLQEYLTANGIKTEQDIKNNPEIVANAKEYALEESRRATFRQDSYLANKIGEVERKNPLYGLAVGSIIPFKKTPINIAKTGIAYSPLGFARNLYDAVQVGKGKMDASEAVDHLAQTLTGTSLTLIGFALAEAGLLNGAGDDDKEGKYDYQLGEQSYSFNFGGDTYSLSWLSPVAMPLFVGANAYEKFVEKSEWDMNVVIDTLAQTLDPLSEMSFLSSLDDVLSSYDSGIEKFMGAGESMVQNYITQFVPTLSSQFAALMDDTKRSTKASGDSGFEFGEETLKKIMYKVPGLRNKLEPTTDIWGNDYKQTEDLAARGFESFLSPANKREGIGTAVDDELKALYGEVGKAEILPSIPYDYIDYGGSKYDLSAKDYTEYKQTYGQTAYDLMESLFDTDTYKNATAEEKADMVADVYDYARDEAKRQYFVKYGVDFTNSTKDGDGVYKENPIKGAIEADMPVDEYVFSKENAGKYNFLKSNGVSYDSFKAANEDEKRAYDWAYKNPEKFELSKAVTDDLFEYRRWSSELYDIKADKDENGESISGSAKEKKRTYIFGLDLDYGQKAILYRSLYDSKDDKAEFNMTIVNYLNSREDISYEQMVAILTELDFKVNGQYITW